MADRTDGEELAPEKLAQFSISGSSINSAGVSIDENKPPEQSTKSKGPSRFKVARVDFAEDAGKSASEAEQDVNDNKGKNYRRNRQESTCSNFSELSPQMSQDSYSGTHTGTHGYDTHNLKTFGQNTLETLPHMDHYRNLLSATGAMKKRPTLLELHEYDQQEQEAEQLVPEVENGNVKLNGSALNGTIVEDLNVSVKPAPTTGPKFGWIKGVLVRCLLNIWGVMLFLRLSWVVGQAGIGLSTMVILLSGVVTTITALSMSAICTNGEVRGGGAYFMISRSLGPEFGGAIGLIFSLANAVAVAMYVVGFAETIRDILKHHDRLMVDEINDVRIIGVITVICLLGIAMAGMEWEAKAQLGLLAILLLAIANFVIGSFIPPTSTEKAKGFTGYSGQTFSDNFAPDFRDGEGFFSVFAIFFPAATGILAGANISGDLADAQSAIPKGTLWAILISTITYVAMALMAGATTVRDASGVVAAAVVNTTFAPGATVSSMMSDDGDGINNVTREAVATCIPGECSFGLQNDMQVMQLVSGWAPLVITGIIAATLSSALASLVSAPKVFQAVCKDKIFPYIYLFAKGYGKGNEPWRGYLLTFFIALGCICIGELNAIAPLISNFFLMSYALINYSCFDASLAKSPGWRPAFKYYSMWMALLGALLCLAIMFVIEWITALITFGVVFALYVYVHYRKPDINWGSSTQAHVYKNALQSTLKLVSVMDHIKNYRPQVLVMTGFPSDRPALVDFAANITKNLSLLICGQVLLTNKEQHYSIKDIRSRSRKAYQWLHDRKVKGFYSCIATSGFRQGAQALMQCVGTGKLRPNTVIMGFKSNWRTATGAEIEEYVDVIHDAFDMHYGVGILRLAEGLDYSQFAMASYGDDCSGFEVNSKNGHVNPAFSSDSPSGSAVVPPTPPDKTPPPATRKISTQTKIFTISPIDLPTNSEKAKMSPSASDSALGRVLCASTPAPKTRSVSASSIVSVHDDKEFVPLNHSPGESCTEEGQIEIQMEDLEEGDGDGPHLHPEVLRKGSQLPVINKEMLKNLNRFQRKQKKGYIDVWWLFDDGGLTLLIPYILSNKSYWQNCKLRVFTAGTKKGELDRDQRNMATLLSKFRIDYSTMTVLPDIGKKPSSESQKEFNSLISDWMLDDSKGETPETHPWKITESDLQTQKEKTNRHIRLRELLKKHSTDASLIVMTLPMPKKGLCSSALYMAWLATLTRDMPPILLLRGNQDSVLTYYS